MPTVLRLFGFLFHFYSDAGREPAHIHVRSVNGECEFWLDPIMLAGNRGVPAHEAREAERLVFENRAHLIEKYHEVHHD